MPRYYIDIENGKRICRDQDGSEYPDAMAARRELITTIAQMVKDAAVPASGGDITGRIHDAHGNLIYTATVSLEVRCMT